MSAVTEPGMSDSIRAESRGIRFFALAGLIVAVHLAGLVVLLTTEYGPFAITLSVLAWVFVNCLLLVVLQRPVICAALALALIVILIALSHFKFGILQLTLTFLDFLIIDRDTFSFLLSVFPRLQMQLIDGGARCGSAVVADLAFRSVPRAPPPCVDGSGGDGRIDRGDGGRIARAGVGAVPGRQSYLQSGALGRGGGVAAGVDRMDRGRSAGERPAQPRAGRPRRRPACAAIRRGLRRHGQAAAHHHAARRVRASTSPRRRASKCRRDTPTTSSRSTASSGP